MRSLAYCVQQFNGDMPKIADTDHPASAGGGDMVHQQRFEYCDDAAQQRSCGLDVDAFRKWPTASRLVAFRQSHHY